MASSNEEIPLPLLKFSQHTLFTLFIPMMTNLYQAFQQANSPVSIMAPNQTENMRSYHKGNNAHKSGYMQADGGTSRYLYTKSTVQT